MNYQPNGTLAGQLVTVIREAVGQKATPKATLIVSTPPQWQRDAPQRIPVEFFGRDSERVPATLGEGADVEVDYVLRGSEYKGKYYAKLSGVTVRVRGAMGQTPATVPVPVPAASPASQPAAQQAPCAPPAEHFATPADDPQDALPF